jgi:hypothetical protein
VDSTSEVAALRFYVEHARHVVDGHRQRAGNFEAKAGTLLAFCGVLLALTPVTIEPIGDLRGTWRVVTAVVVSVASLLFLAAAFASLRVLAARPVVDGDEGQVAEAWLDHQSARDARDERVLLGIVADQMLGDDGTGSAVHAHGADADARGSWFRHATYLLVGGMSVLSASVLILLIEVAKR